MINILNFFLLKEYTTQQPAVEVIESWLEEKNNYERLQYQCDKIWNNCTSNPQYDVERAFRVLSKRFAEVCMHEQSMK